MSDEKDFKQNISADPSNFIAAWRRATETVVGSGEKIDETAKHIDERFESMTKHLQSLAVLATGGMFGEMIKDNLELEDALSKAAKAAGVTTAQFSATAYAAKLSDLSNEDLTKSYAKLGAALTNAQAGQKLQVELFKQLKIDPTSITDADDLLNKLADRFSSMEDGARKTSLAIDVFGEKLGPRLIPFLNEGAEGLGKLREEAKSLGVVVSSEAGEAAERFNDSMTTLGQAVKGASMEIANQMLPTLQVAADKLLSSRESVGELGKAFRTVFETVSVLVANVSFVLQGIGREIGGVAAQLALIAHPSSWGTGQWTAISDAVKADGERARKELDALEKRLMGVDKAVDESASKERKAKPGFEPAAKTPTATAPSRMGDWEATLAEKKAAIEREGLAEGQLRQMSLADETAYWNKIRGMAGLSAQEKTALARKAAESEMADIKRGFDMKVATLQAEEAQYKNNAEAKIEIEQRIQAKYQQGMAEYAAAEKRITEIKRQAAEQRAQIDELMMQAERDHRLAQIALEEQAAQTSVQMGIVTRQQLLQQQEGFEQRRYDIAKEGLQKRLTLAEQDPDRSPLALAKIHADIEALDDAHNARMTAMQNQAALEFSRPWAQATRSITSGITNTLGNAITGLINHTMTLKQAMASAWKGITSSVLGEITKMVAAKVAAWAVDKVLTLAGIGANAAKAGSGAASAVANIPYVGPILAIAAMASVFGAVSGMKSNVPTASAFNGFDIPGNVNPIVQTHAREMILPAKHADVIRNMADGDGGGAVNVHFNVQAMDSESFHRYLVNNTHVLGSAIREAQRTRRV